MGAFSASCDELLLQLAGLPLQPALLAGQLGEPLPVGRRHGLLRVGRELPQPLADPGDARRRLLDLRLGGPQRRRPACRWRRGTARPAPRPPRARAPAAGSGPAARCACSPAASRSRSASARCRSASASRAASRSGSPRAGTPGWAWSSAWRASRASCSSAGGACPGLLQLRPQPPAHLVLQLPGLRRRLLLPPLHLLELRLEGQHLLHERPLLGVRLGGGLLQAGGQLVELRGELVERLHGGGQVALLDGLLDGVERRGQVLLPDQLGQRLGVEVLVVEAARGLGHAGLQLLHAGLEPLQLRQRLGPGGVAGGVAQPLQHRLQVALAGRELARQPHQLAGPGLVEELLEVEDVLLQLGHQQPVGPGHLAGLAAHRLPRPPRARCAPWRTAVARCSAVRSDAATLASACATSRGATGSRRSSAAVAATAWWRARAFTSSAAPSGSRAGVATGPPSESSSRSPRWATSCSQAARAFSMAARRCSASL